MFVGWVISALFAFNVVLHWVRAPVLGLILCRLYEKRVLLKYGNWVHAPVRHVYVIRLITMATDMLLPIVYFEVIEPWLTTIEQRNISTTYRDIVISYGERNDK
jgi:hypothetical protein